MTIYEPKPAAYFKGWHGVGFHEYPPMFHNHAELVYVVSGTIHLTVEGESFTLHDGQLFILFSYLAHSYSEEPDAEVILMLFDPAVTSFANTLLSQKPTYPIIDGTAFARMIERAVMFLQQNKPKIATAYLNAVLGEYLEIVDLDVHTKDQSMTRNILEYCSNHFTEPISLELIADSLSISQSSVSKLFSKRLKYSFRDYINGLRIGQAKSLLHQTSQPITDIMLSCGFTNQSTFNRVFLSICGCSPREYREQLNSPKKTSSIKR